MDVPLDVKKRPEQLPDPWLFDSEKLLRELDRCRELVLLIPTPNHEVHFAANIAIDSIWNLSQQLRFLLSLHRDGQRAFAKKADVLPNTTSNTTPKAVLRHERPSRA